MGHGNVVEAPSSITKPSVERLETLRDTTMDDINVEKRPQDDSFAVDDPVIVRDWTDSQERKVKLKLDFIVLALLMLGLFSLQLDKGNLGFANTTTFATDIGIAPNDINHGAALQAAGIVAFEIPFNMVLSRIGPSLWLTIQIFAWSLIATAQAAITNKAGFYASRFLLGVWEAGYLAASLTILSTFYTRNEMALRVALVYVGNYFSQGVGALLAAAIFSIKEDSGLLQWQWLFIIEGILGFVVAIVFVLFMPQSHSNTLPLCKVKRFNFFNERERQIMDGRVLLDDPRKAVRLSGIGLKRLAVILLDYRIWGHFAINVITIAPKGGLAVYAPTIIKNLGFSTVNASALTSVGNWGVCIVSVLASWVSDKTGLRGPVCIATNAFALLFAGLQYAFVKSNDKWLKFAIFTLLYSGNTAGQGVNDAWLSANIDDAQARCVGLALAVAGSNLAGITGSYLFLENDAPYYPHGFLKVMCLYGGGIGMIVVMIIAYILHNRYNQKHVGNEHMVDNDGVQEINKLDGKVTVKNQL